MSRSGFFWGFILIVVGALFLLNNLNILMVNVWNFIGPIFLVGMGIWILFGPLFSSVDRNSITIPVENNRSAAVNINYGAGRLSISDGAAIKNVIEGDCFGSVAYDVQHQQDKLVLDMSVPLPNFPVFSEPGRQNWNLRFNSRIPMKLFVQTGAAEIKLNLEELNILDLFYQTGASSTELTLPSSGKYRAQLKAGVASLNVRVPEGVAARIRSSIGLGALNVDQHRFPKKDSYFQSKDYEAASNSVELEIEAGLSSVDIR